MRGFKRFTNSFSLYRKKQKKFFSPFFLKIVFLSLLNLNTYHDTLKHDLKLLNMKILFSERLSSFIEFLYGGEVIICHYV